LLWTKSPRFPLDPRIHDLFFSFLVEWVRCIFSRWQRIPLLNGYQFDPGMPIPLKPPPGRLPGNIPRSLVYSALSSFKRICK
jgi:hypothetical protein